MPVLLVGDSHLARFAPYPRLIAPDCTVRAVGGASAADLEGQLGDLDPAAFDVIAVSVGTNDCGVRPASLEDFLASIRAFLERVAPTPVLLVNNPGADERAVDYDDSRMKQYAAEAAALVRSAGGAVVDIPRVIAPLGRLGRTPEGLHVSKLGHLLLVPALRRGLRQARRSS
jgi:hypothetical protein